MLCMILFTVIYIVSTYVLISRVKVNKFWYFLLVIVLFSLGHQRKYQGDNNIPHSAGDHVDLHITYQYILWSMTFWDDIKNVKFK